MHTLTLPAGEMNEFDLPRVCVVTGQTGNVEFKPVKFAWYPRWIVSLVILNVLIAAIVAYAMTRRVAGSLPFTPEAYEQWKRGRLLMSLSMVGALGMLFGALSLFISGRDTLGGVALLLTFVVPTTVWVKLARNRGPVVQRIGAGSITLQVPSEEAARRIGQHLNAGAVSPVPRAAPSA